MTETFKSKMLETDVEVTHDAPQGLVWLRFPGRFLAALDVENTVKLARRMLDAAEAVQPGAMEVHLPRRCEPCGGTGHRGFDDCGACGGTGRVVPA